MTRRILVLALLLLTAASGLTAAAAWSMARLEGSTGLIETVYQGTEFSGPPLLWRAAGAIDLSVLDEHPNLPRRRFSVRFTGTWLVPTPGPVEIYAGADDSVRVSIDNVLIIERNPQVGLHTKAAEKTISAGPHQILVEYVQHGGDASLKVLWAPAGGAPRPFSPESLFVGVPDAKLIWRARRAARLGSLSRAAWIAFGTVALSLSLFSLGRAGRHWIARGTPQGLVRRTVHAVGRLQAQYGRHAFWLGSAAAVLWIAGTRTPALNPQTLWSDDVAVACLTKLDSLWTAVTAPAPLPPGFTALLWVARRTMADPEVSLQVLPLAFGLAGPVLLGIVVSRLTSSYLLGLVAVVLGLGNANLAQYSVFIKSYSLDYALTALFLLLAFLLLVEGTEVRLATAAAGLAAALFSVPSAFLSLALVPVAAVAPGSGRRNGPWSTWLRWGTVAGFGLLLACMYIFVLRTRSNPALRAWWSINFAPTTSLTDLAGFLRTTGWTAIREALPDPFMALAPLAAIGLAALVIRPKHRWFGLFVTLVYAGAIAASMLQLYPIGTGSRARVSIYLYPLTTGLVVVGFDALTRWRLIRPLARSVAAVVVVLGIAKVEPPAYPALDLVQIVRALESRVTPADAIVFNTPGAGLAGYYASWPISVYADQSPYGFAVRVERPRTLTLPRLSEEGEPGLEVLDAFLVREHPPRLFFLSTRRGTTAAENAIRAHGFTEVRRMTSRISTHLVEYRRGEP